MESTIILQPIQGQGMSLILRSPANDLMKISDRLLAILEKFENWKDPLSLRLFKWGAKIIQIFIHSDFQTSLGQENFVQKMASKADKLKNRVLINSFGEPILEPVIDRQWVWEKWMLVDYLKLSRSSPFDNELIQVNSKIIEGKTQLFAKTHLFAKEMLQLLKEIERATNEEREEQQVAFQSDEVGEQQVTFQPDEGAGQQVAFQSNEVAEQQIIFQSQEDEIKSVTLPLYDLLVKRAKEVEKKRQEAKQARKARPILETVFQQRQETNDMQLEVMRHQFLEHEEIINRRIEFLDTTHQQTTQILQTEISDGQQRLQRVEEESQMLRKTCNEQRVEIIELRRAFDAKTREVQSLGGGGGGGCTIL